MSLILWWKIINIYFLIIIKHISFSVILASILRAGKKHFLGNLAVRFVCRMRSTFANRRIAHALSESRLFFAGKHQLPSQTGPLPRIDFFYVNQRSNTS